MKSTAFSSLAHAIKADFGYAIEQFKRNTGSANFNKLTDAALALQQVEWLGRTSTVTASERELIAKQVLELHRENWGKFVVLLATQIHQPA